MSRVPAMAFLGFLLACSAASGRECKVQVPDGEKFARDPIRVHFYLSSQDEISDWSRTVLGDVQLYPPGHAVKQSFFNWMASFRGVGVNFITDTKGDYEVLVVATDKVIGGGCCDLAHTVVHPDHGAAIIDLSKDYADGDWKPGTWRYVGPGHELLHVAGERDAARQCWDAISGHSISNHHWPLDVAPGGGYPTRLLDYDVRALRPVYK